MIDLTNSKIEGHIRITDKHTGEILVDKDNAIHNGNLANTIARALAGDSTAHLKYMAFGNGGTQIDATGSITYKAPNVSDIKDPTVALYNETYKKRYAGTNLEDGNSITTLDGVSNYTDVVITVTLEYGEPADQDASDGSDINPADFESDYVFDEIALYEAGEDTEEYGLMVTHVMFHPVKKSSNREIEIEYTLRIQVS